MDVEAALTKQIAAIGGVHVRSIVGDNPSFENADFLFSADCVVAELKSLDDDKMFDERIIKAASDLYVQELENDRSLPVIFGEMVTSTAGRSEAFTRKIAALYEKPIKGLVERANRQIRETVEALNVLDAKGLLIVANNGHSALDPSHANYLLQRVLRRQTYSSINSVIYMSAGQRVALADVSTPVDVVIEIRRNTQPPVAAEFIAKFRSVWYQCLTVHRGISEHHEVEVDQHTLLRLENRGEA
jgi:predicted CoA-binding protein